MAPQIVTITEPTLPRGVVRIKWNWLCDELGAVISQTVRDYSGMIVRLVTVPNGGGTAPTTLYDVTITDSDGIDVINALGANLSATVTAQQISSAGLQWIANSRLTLNVTNAGIEKGGAVYLYILEATVPG